MRSRVRRAGADRPAPRRSGAPRWHRVHFGGLRLFDRRDVDLHEAQLAEHVHGAHHRLVRGAPVGAHGDRLVAIRARHLDNRRAQRVGTVVDELAVVHAVAAALRDRDDQGVALLPAGGREARLRQLDLEPPFLHERRRQHEEDDEQQRDVDERDQVDLGIFLRLARLELHALRASRLVAAARRRANRRT